MLKFEYPHGATPLDPDEAIGLIPRHISLQSELNEWEETNILKAENWLFSKKSFDNIFEIDFLKLVHKKMFDDVWKWAGVFRQTEKSIGVAPFNISTDLKNLLEDIQYQLIHASKNSTIDHQNIDEIACRLHHRLVFIHPFPNGNGRHARLMTDILLTQTGRPRFSWGNNNLTQATSARGQYIAALKNADKHDYKALLAFVRS